MTRKCLSLLLVCVLLCSTFTGCITISRGSAPAEPEIAFAGDDFCDKAIPIFCPDGESSETALLRFYEDLPSVAYIGLHNYYSLITETALTVENHGDGTYTAVTPGGSEAFVDTNTDTLTIPDYLAFTNTVMVIQEGAPSVYLDGAPYFRAEGVRFDKEPEVVTFDLSAYGIDLKEGEEGVYFPLNILANIFTNLPYHYVAYNGEKLYINNGPGIGPSISEQDESRTYPFLYASTRPDDMAEHTYKELCFALDHFFGRPGSAAIEEYPAGMPLDEILQSTEEGREIRELILSTDPDEFLLGIHLLNELYFDGGHTWFTFITLHSNRRLVKSLQAEPGGAYADMLNYIGLNKKLTALREEMLGNEFYHKEGDTMVFHLNSFSDIDLEGWDAYYAGGELPVGTDNFAQAITALDAAAADPEIKNFVIDISTNGGGSLDMLVSLLKVVSGSTEVRYEERLTGQMVYPDYRVDTNLDGVFDGKDDKLRYSHLNFAVLTSPLSFSCGNLFPALMKDLGYPILGERSGGGTCAVQQIFFGETFISGISTVHCRLYNADGETIDDGVPVDVELVVDTPDGADYSAFYDIGRLSDEINAFYAESALTPAA